MSIAVGSGRWGRSGLLALLDSWRSFVAWIGWVGLLDEIKKAIQFDIMTLQFPLEFGVVLPGGERAIVLGQCLVSLYNNALDDTCHFLFHRLKFFLHIQGECLEFILMLGLHFGDGV